jgi:hypothetical protein
MDYQEADQAWQWFHDHVNNPVNIAYTGTNLSFPLYGNKLQNEVFYANINAHPDWLFHDYHAYFAEKSDYPLQVSTPTPVFYRMEPDPNAWIQNLAYHNTDYVVISALHPFEWYYPHDSDGFPYEDAWATMSPKLFQQVFSTKKIRIYKINKSLFQ